MKRRILENEKTLSDIKKRLNTSILHFEMSLKKDLDGKLHGVNENINIRLILKISLTSMKI